MSLMINKTQFRAFLLDCAAQKKMSDGSPRFERVADEVFVDADEVFVDADAALKSWGRNFVAQHPTLGRTLKK